MKIGFFYPLLLTVKFLIDYLKPVIETLDWELYGRDFHKWIVLVKIKWRGVSTEEWGTSRFSGFLGLEVRIRSSLEIWNRSFWNVYNIDNLMLALLSTKGGLPRISMLLFFCITIFASMVSSDEFVFLYFYYSVTDYFFFNEPVTTS